MKSTLALFSTLPLALALAGTSANAAATLTFATSSVAGGGQTYSPFTVSNTDLLQTSVASSSTTGTFTNAGSTVPNIGAPALTNGVFVITGGNPADNSQLPSVGNNSSITYNLDLSTNLFGYDISNISTYGGWNDAGRDAQNFQIYVSRVGDPGFFLFDSVNVNPPGSANPSAVRAVFASNLTHVDAIQFVFPNGQENGYAGYGEFDVIGLASLPEPGKAFLGLASSAAWCFFRRRKAVAK